MDIFVFDIETVPDVSSGRRLLDLPGISDEQVGRAMLSLSKEATGSAFLKPHLQQIVAISAVLREKDKIKVWSLGEVNAQEPELIQRFFKGIEKFIPTMVSWNGTGFDLPVLHYRSLLHGIPAPKYWESGEKDHSFKYNNYLNRYHTRHIDLMDTLAGYQPKAFAQLDEIAKMLGFPGKLGIGGDQVWDYYLRNDLASIRDYCEADVLNTYLVFLKFQLMRGELSPEKYIAEINFTKTFLQNSAFDHHQEFLKAWEV